MQKETLDCKGIACPMPVIQAKKKLEENQQLELEVIVDNKEAVENVKRLAQSLNLPIDVKDNGGDIYNLTIKKTGDEQPLSCDPMTIVADEAMTMLIKTRYFGEGDSEKFENGLDVLGGNLMKTFIFSLTESKPFPKKLMFVNSGVYLTTINEETVKNLKILQEGGTEIISCGICLDFYNLKDKLQVGSVGNMYDITNSLNASRNKLVI